jgi:hypothetical protein
MKWSHHDCRKNLKVRSHMIRSAWKWYGLVGLGACNDSGCKGNFERPRHFFSSFLVFLVVLQNMIGVACNSRIPQANSQAVLNFVHAKNCGQCFNHIWNCCSLVLYCTYSIVQNELSLPLWLSLQRKAVFFCSYIPKSNILPLATVPTLLSPFSKLPKVNGVPHAVFS